MNKIAFKKQAVSLLLGLGICILPGNIGGAEVQESDECAQEILLAYFPSVFVKETLSHFKVPQDQWDAINKELAERDKDIIKKVEAKAAKMNPNPLKDPQQRQATVKIFRDTIYENFADVMKAHGIKDDKQIQSMLDDIQQQKAKRFARCMQKQSPVQPPEQQQATRSKEDSKAPSKSNDTPEKEDDSDEDSEDEDDDHAG